MTWTQAFLGWLRINGVAFGTLLLAWGLYDMARGLWSAACKCFRLGDRPEQHKAQRPTPLDMYAEADAQPLYAKQSERLVSAMLSEESLEREYPHLTPSQRRNIIIRRQQESHS